MNVQLVGEWTDGNGNHHSAGETVDVDPITLAQLQAQGIVSEGAGGGNDTTNWVGPTTTKP